MVDVFQALTDGRSIITSGFISNDGELSRRIDEYMEEFEENGLNNVSVNKE